MILPINLLSTEYQLSLHLGKTEHILKGAKRRLRDAGDFRVTCDDGDVRKFEKVRNLGFMLDRNLNWQVQTYAFPKWVFG